MASEMSNQSHTIQLIGGNGVFNFGFNGFMNDLMKRMKLVGCSYRVVSIIGPQSSGKSTLLNKLFQTSFEEMNVSKGRHQTTKGIWLATCADIGPFTLVVDVEGTDGNERGNDDTAFENQSALFALAVSDIIIINMWCQDIGRNHAANMPLMRIVFQVMVRLLKPRKTMLLFVIRDKTMTPFESLKQQLLANIQALWNSTKKDRNDTQLEDFFSMEFVALPHYDYEQENFKKQVQDLKERFFCPFTSEGLASNRPEVVPIIGFAQWVAQMWKTIQADKDLNLPELTKMVANFRCEEIVQQKQSHLLTNKAWCKLKSDAQLGRVDGFGEKLREILKFYLSEYDKEAACFDEDVSSDKRRQLELIVLNDAYPAYQHVVQQLSARNLDKFKNDFDRALQRGEGFAVAAEICLSQCLSEFDKGCADAYVESASWDPSEVREKLRLDIYKHTLEELVAQYEKQLSAALEEPVGPLLQDGGNDTWPKIRELLGREIAAKRKCLSRDLSDLKIDKKTTRKKLESLAAFGRSVVEKRARDEARNVLIYMKDRFLKSFDISRKWTEQDDIKSIAQAAFSGSLVLLSVMAVIRLDEKTDKMKNTLSLSDDPPASITWEGVPEANVLIRPSDCKSLLAQFKEEIRPFLEQAFTVQKYAAKLSAAEAKVKAAEELAASVKKDAEKARLASEEKAQKAEAAEQALEAAEAKAAELQRLAAAQKQVAAAEKKATLKRLAAAQKQAAAAEKERLAAEAKAKVAAAEAKAAEQARLDAERERANTEERSQSGARGFAQMVIQTLMRGLLYLLGLDAERYLFSD